MSDTNTPVANGAKTTSNNGVTTAQSPQGSELLQFLRMQQEGQMAALSMLMAFANQTRDLLLEEVRAQRISRERLAK